jgi:hypothetical protein
LKPSRERRSIPALGYRPVMPSASSMPTSWRFDTGSGTIGTRGSALPSE